MLPIVYMLNDIRATEFILNTRIMLPHLAYKLYVAKVYLRGLLFIYTKKTPTQSTQTTVRAD